MFPGLLLSTCEDVKARCFEPEAGKVSEYFTAKVLRGLSTTAEHSPFSVESFWHHSKCPPDAVRPGARWRHLLAGKANIINIPSMRLALSPIGMPTSLVVAEVESPQAVGVGDIFKLHSFASGRVKSMSKDCAETVDVIDIDVGNSSESGRSGNLLESSMKRVHIGHGPTAVSLQTMASERVHLSASTSKPFGDDDDDDEVIESRDDQNQRYGIQADIQYKENVVHRVGDSVQVAVRMHTVGDDTNHIIIGKDGNKICAAKIVRKLHPKVVDVHSVPDSESPLVKVCFDDWLPYQVSLACSGANREGLGIVIRRASSKKIHWTSLPTAASTKEEYSTVALRVSKTETLSRAEILLEQEDYA